MPPASVTQTATLLLIGGVVGFVAGVGVERRTAAQPPVPAIAASPAATIDVPQAATVAVPTQLPAFERAPVSSAIVTHATDAVAGAPVRITGRFADAAEKASVRSVSAMVESTKISATFEPAAGAAFTIDVPTAKLIPATHTMTVLFSENAGEVRRISPNTGFALTSPRVAAVPALGAGKGEGGVDVFARIAVPQAETRGDVVLDKGSYAVMEGWAYDPQAHRAASNVYVSIDGRTYLSATTGLDRPDVVKALGPTYAGAGFQAAFGTAGLSAGTHVVGLLAVDDASKRSYAFPQTFRLTVQ